jgi:hypothetical protein
MDIAITVLATREIKNRRRMAGDVETVFDVVIGSLRGYAVHYFSYDGRDIQEETLYVAEDIAEAVKAALGDDPDPASLGFCDTGVRIDNPRAFAAVDALSLVLVYEL